MSEFIVYQSWYQSADPPVKLTPWHSEATHKTSHEPHSGSECLFDGDTNTKIWHPIVPVVITYLFTEPFHVSTYELVNGQWNDRTDWDPVSWTVECIGQLTGLEKWTSQAGG